MRQSQNDDLQTMKMSCDYVVAENKKNYLLWYVCLLSQQYM